MPVTAWKTAGTVTKIEDGGRNMFGDNPTALGSSDDSNCYQQTWGSSSDPDTKAIELTNFGFGTGDIPDGSTIDGIEFQVELHSSNDMEDTDSTTKSPGFPIMIIGGSRTGTPQTQMSDAGDVYLPDPDAYLTYGGSTAKMGTSLTDAQARASDTGIAFSWMWANGSNSKVFVDHIQLRYHYSAGGPAPPGPWIHKRRIPTYLRAR